MGQENLTLTPLPSGWIIKWGMTLKSMQQKNEFSKDKNYSGNLLGVCRMLGYYLKHKFKQCNCLVNS